MQKQGKGGDVPIVLALSNPTDKAECTAEEAFKACGGRVAFGSGTTFQPFKAADGHEVTPSQANNSLIFPGDNTPNLLQLALSLGSHLEAAGVTLPGATCMTNSEANSVPCSLQCLLYRVGFCGLMRCTSLSALTEVPAVCCFIVDQKGRCLRREKQCRATTMSKTSLIATLGSEDGS